jgi:hypothetical protein
MNPIAGLEDSQTLNLTKVSVRHFPYNVEQIQILHKHLVREFGTLNRDWGFNIRDIESLPNVNMNLTIEYWFKDAKKASLFMLKYANKQFDQ